MERVDSEASYISDEDSDSSDSDTSDEEETDPNQYGVEGLLLKCRQRIYSKSKISNIYFRPIFGDKYSNICPTGS